ncbi:MAG: hypothetical protein IJ727_05015 [Treponema sp.]|nr:hypothetical protein [Treponema sp.]
MKNKMLYTKFFLIIALSITAVSCKKIDTSEKQGFIRGEQASYEEYKITFPSQPEKKAILLCRIPAPNCIQVSAEDFCKLIGQKYEICGRCGKTSLFLKNGDTAQIEWNSPYVSFANKPGRIELDSFNMNEKGKTFTQIDLFSRLDIADFSITENEIRVENFSVSQ